MDPLSVKWCCQCICFPHVSKVPTISYKWVSIVVAQNVESLSCLLILTFMCTSCKSDIKHMLDFNEYFVNTNLIVIYSFAVSAGYLNVKDVYEHLYLFCNSVSSSCKRHTFTQFKDMFKISYQKTLIIIQSMLYYTLSNAQEVYVYENVKFGLYSIKIMFCLHQ